jgi:hypothetical protein
MGYIEIAFCKMSRGGSTGERARKRAATAVSLLMTVGVNRVPLHVSNALQDVCADILILHITRDERDSSEFTLLQQCVRRRRDKIAINTRCEDESIISPVIMTGQRTHAPPVALTTAS